MTLAVCYLRHRRAFSISLSEMPFARAQDSTAASPYWATAFLTTQQGTACAGNESTSAEITTMARIISVERTLIVPERGPAGHQVSRWPGSADPPPLA